MNLMLPYYDRNWPEIFWSPYGLRRKQFCSVSRNLRGLGTTGDELPCAMAASSNRYDLPKTSILAWLWRKRAHDMFAGLFLRAVF